MGILYNIVSTIFIGGIVVGLYGSPDTGGLYTNEKIIRTKIKRSLQTRKWLWIIMILFDIFFLFTVGFDVASISTVLLLDCMIINIASVINLIFNLFKKKNIKDDVIFILSSIVAFFIIAFILGSLSN